MVKSTLEFIMLMCVHLSAQDRHQGARWGEPGRGGQVGANRRAVCARTDSRAADTGAVWLPP